MNIFCKCLLSLFILVYLQHLSFGQSTRFQQEVNSLDSLLRKTKSFKQQIKGDRKQLYQQKKAELLASPDTAFAWQRFLLLTELLDLAKDNHLGFYQRVNYQLFKTREQIDSLYAATYFRDVPSVNWNLESLKKELAGKSKEDIEGIFHYGSDFNLGILKTGEQQYMGVVLESSTPYVKPGHIMAWLRKKKTIGFQLFTCTRLPNISITTLLSAMPINNSCIPNCIHPIIRVLIQKS